MAKNYYPPTAMTTIAELASSYSDAEITEMFARTWDSLAAQAVEAKNNAKAPADAQSWHEAFSRRNRRALFWWGANSMAPKLTRG